MKGPSLKEVVEQETTQLLEQQKRLSVRDLASKFDKNLAAVAKLSDEAKLREVASLEGHVVLKKLRDAFESSRGRLAGRNKEDVEKAISMVEALAIFCCLKAWETGYHVLKLRRASQREREDGAWWDLHCPSGAGYRHWKWEAAMSSKAPSTKNLYPPPTPPPPHEKSKGSKRKWERNNPFKSSSSPLIFLSSPFNATNYPHPLSHLHKAPKFPLASLANLT
ncbi:hypothetical protein F0562_001825 [Nyssa sinensis]|uniref:Stomatal closure-related actin-binding protein coiled-coil domain-containing protein n=1 Tax=Nyssa sinensis TaxID=561372 RepID=A0A5J5C4T5_9ASTE|nr:hypothetical protein F0562_001825 [Nyssa sinensis]